MSELSGQYIRKMGDSGKSEASFTRPDNTTAYTALDVCATATTNLTFSDVMKVSGNTFKIVGATLEIDKNAVPAGMTSFVLHLYDAAPTLIADNAPFNLPSGDRDKYIGNITLTTPVDIGDTLWSQNSPSMAGKLVAKDLFGILVTTTGWTPASEDVFKVTIYTESL